MAMPVLTTDLLFIDRYIFLKACIVFSLYGLVRTVFTGWTLGGSVRHVFSPSHAHTYITRR